MIETCRKFIPAVIQRNNRNKQLFVKVLQKPVRIRLLHDTKAIQENVNEKDSLTHHSFKRYVTRCYIKPVHIPYWYSETVQLKIGSNVKNYDEKVHFKSTYMPYHWKESMTTFTPQTGEPLIYKSYLEIPIKTDFHYMSLEPQQIKTDDKNLVETYL